MLANLPVEIILLICEYPEFKDLGQLAWTNKRTMQIIKKYLPKALERKTLFYLPYNNNDIRQGRICLFDSHTNSVEQIAKFTYNYESHQVAITKDKMFAIESYKKSFEMFDLNTRKITRGPDPPEWRRAAFVAYFKDRLYYLGGIDPKTYLRANRVDVLIDGKWQTGPAFPLPTREAQAITCDGILYVIDGYTSNKIYRLSDDEREWIEIGEILKNQSSFGVASLNGRIYISRGSKWDDWILRSCLCFDPSAPVESQFSWLLEKVTGTSRYWSRTSQIADMNHARYSPSLVATNGKLYAVGGYQEFGPKNFCNSIEEYDPQTNKWRDVGEFNI